MTTYKQHEMCDEVVRRGVIHCVSTLICELQEVAESLDDHDTYLDLCIGQPDYDECMREAVYAADVSDLYDLIDYELYVSEFLEGVGVVPTPEKLAEFAEDECLDPDDDPLSEWFKSTTALEYLRDIDLNKIRETLLDSQDDPEEFCRVHKVDAEENWMEVFEHWIVDSWLGQKLEQRGEIVRQFLGLTIWGRCCTGQAISLDGVIRDIAKEFYGEEWDKADGEQND